MKSKATDFIAYALERAKPDTVPSGADLAIPLERVGSFPTYGPWEYLYGTTGVLCTKAVLDERFDHYYSKKGWTREAYDLATAGLAGKRYVCDCEGLLDSFLGNDVTANFCYAAWCTDKGSVSAVSRPWQIGEAVFRVNSDGNMVHVGFVCGFDRYGEPLVVEERGIRYGCVVTKYGERNWTHRGLVTKKLSYEEEPIVGWLISPEAIKSMQTALNLNGCTDYEDEPLKVDGKWGKRSQSAFDKMCREHGPEAEMERVEIYIDGALVQTFNVLKEEL